MWSPLGRVRRRPHASQSRESNRYDLKGTERFFTITKQGCARIAHALYVTGPVDSLLPYMLPSFRMVLNRHPKMRILMSTNPREPLTGYVQPRFETDLEIESLVTIVQNNGDTEVQRKEKVRKHIDIISNKPVDRTKQYPYFLTVLVSTKAADELTLLLFSDHAFSDGLSGAVVLNDLLVNIRLLVSFHRQYDEDVVSVDYNGIKAQLDEQCKQHPLRPPIYDQIRGHLTPVGRCMDVLINSTGRIAAPILLKRFRPVLPAREDLHDMHSLPFPANKTYCLLESGTKENLDSALQACRREKTTLTGAITACILLAVAKMRYPDPEKVPESDFKLHFNVAFNMRGRIKSPFPETTVGPDFMGVSLEPLATKGVKLSNRFWDVARSAKRHAEAGLNSLATKFELAFTHQYFNSANPGLKNINIHKGVAGDVALSNLGRYPFPTTHPLGALGDISVKGMHFYSSVPHMSPLVAFFISSTDHLDYATAHKMSDADGAKIFQLVVKSIETMATIDCNETMLEACKRNLVG